MLWFNRKKKYVRKTYGAKTEYAGTNVGRMGIPNDWIIVKLGDGSEIWAAPYRGGWMGSTKERPFPDFLETGTPAL